MTKYMKTDSTCKMDEKVTIYNEMEKTDAFYNEIGENIGATNNKMHSKNMNDAYSGVIECSDKIHDEIGENTLYVRGRPNHRNFQHSNSSYDKADKKLDATYGEMNKIIGTLYDEKDTNFNPAYNEIKHNDAIDLYDKMGKKMDATYDGIIENSDDIYEEIGENINSLHDITMQNKSSFVTQPLTDQVTKNHLPLYQTKYL